MNDNKRAISTRQMVFIGLMSAMVFVTNYISFQIPLMSGAPTRIHIANGFCLIAGLALGGVQGGIAAGFGSMLYDFTNPAYVASAPFTLVFKFLLAFTAGKIARTSGSDANNRAKNILACVAGQALYIILYLGKKFISGLLLGNAFETVVVSVATSLASSVVNGVIAVVIAVLLLPMFKAAIKSRG